MKFSVATIVASLTAISGVAAVPLAADANGPDPNQVWVTGFTYGGTGCPSGSVASAMAQDRKSFTLIFDKYVVSSGKGVSAIENRKNCQLNFGLHYPPGWQYSVFEATYRGYCAIPKGQSGTQKSTYYFTGATTKQCSTQSNFNGPYNGDYVFNDRVDFTTEVWSPCGTEGLLNINSQIRLDKPAVDGLLTTDSIDGKFTQICLIADIANRDIDIQPAASMVDMVKKFEPVSVVESSSMQKRSPENEEPIPVTGSDYNKREAMKSESDLDKMEEPEVQKRATTMSPNVGIPQDLPTGIIIFMIVFMFYAMITAISMKDTD
ncbi:hypothetical protein Dda_3158 [Drechslerella dactyloides]|uniref:Secreted protein n=1 Tax=Drechslerella dactyloides TaxID=74499 RepID=A0AAD6J369_DREDA|nr:hypothetical protein Dda_3158 [Drechslerella dactyloides]